MTIISARPGARGRASLGVFSSVAAATPLGDVTNVAGSATPGFSEARQLKRRVSWAPEGTLGRAGFGFPQGEGVVRRLDERRSGAVEPQPQRVPVTPAATLARKLAPPRAVEEDPELPRRHRLASQARRLPGTGRLTKRRDVEARLRETLQSRMREAVEQTGAALKERSAFRRQAYFRELHEWQAAQARALEAADERRHREQRELVQAEERRRAEEARREAEAAATLAFGESDAWGAMLGDQDEVDDLKARLGFGGERRTVSYSAATPYSDLLVHAPTGHVPVVVQAPQLDVAPAAHLAPPAHALPKPSIITARAPAVVVGGGGGGSSGSDSDCEVVEVVRAAQRIKRGGTNDAPGTLIQRSVDMGTSPTVPKVSIAPAATRIDIGTSPMVVDSTQGVDSPGGSDGDGLEVDLSEGMTPTFAPERDAGGDDYSPGEGDEVEAIEEFTVMHRRVAEEDAPMTVTPQTPEVWYETVQVDEEVSFRLLSTGKKPEGALAPSARLTPGHTPLISFDDEDTVVFDGTGLGVEDGPEATSNRPQLDPILEQLDTPVPVKYVVQEPRNDNAIMVGPLSDWDGHGHGGAEASHARKGEEEFTVCENEEDYAYEGGGGDGEEWNLPGADEDDADHENDENADPGVPVMDEMEAEITVSEALKRRTPKPRRMRKDVIKTPNRKPSVKTKKRGPRLQHRKSIRGGQTMEIECIEVNPNTPATGDTPATGMPGGPPNEPGVAPRRGKRWRIRPLEYWNNERVVYTRAYDELPTLAEVQMHAHSDDDDDDGVGASYKPGKRKRRGRKPDPDFPTP